MISFTLSHQKLAIRQDSQTPTLAECRKFQPNDDLNPMQAASCSVDKLQENLNRIMQMLSMVTSALFSSDNNTPCLLLLSIP